MAKNILPHMAVNFAEINNGLIGLIKREELDENDLATILLNTRVYDDSGNKNKGKYLKIGEKVSDYLDKSFFIRSNLKFNPYSNDYKNKENTKVRDSEVITSEDIQYLEKSLNNVNITSLLKTASKEGGLALQLYYLKRQDWQDNLMNACRSIVNSWKNGKVPEKIKNRVGSKKKKQKKSNVINKINKIPKLNKPDKFDKYFNKFDSYLVKFDDYMDKVDDLENNYKKLEDNITKITESVKKLEVDYQKFLDDFKEMTKQRGGVNNLKDYVDKRLDDYLNNLSVKLDKLEQVGQDLLKEVKSYKKDINDHYNALLKKIDSYVAAA